MRANALLSRWSWVQAPPPPLQLHAGQNAEQRDVKAADRPSRSHRRSHRYPRKGLHATRLAGHAITIAILTLLAALLVAYTPSQTATAAGATPHPTAPAATCHPIHTTVKHRRASLEQRRMIHRILSVGRNRKMPNKVMRASLAAATQESKLKNIVGGDGSSTGLFQMIDSWEPDRPGTQRLDPEWAARWFFRNAITVYRRDPSQSINSIAQGVEASGHPTAYKQWAKESTKTYQRWLKGCAA